jgi:hypothetical protein
LSATKPGKRLKPKPTPPEPSDEPSGVAFDDLLRRMLSTPRQFVKKSRGKAAKR